MLLPIGLALGFALVFILIAANYAMPRSAITDKSICIIGGTSGLGLALAKEAFALGNRITITSRSVARCKKTLNSFEDSNISSITGKVFDSVTNLTDIGKDFDYVFYCAGMAIPGYFKDQNPEVFERQMDLNYTGMVRTLYHLKRSRRRPLTFVMVASTLALFTLPGYSSYSPSKAALRVFTEGARYELAKDDIHLKVLYACTINTPGTKTENRVKPDFTREMEYHNTVVEPEAMARYMMRNIHWRDALAYDWVTYFAMVRSECELAFDYLVFPVSVVFVWALKLWIRFKYSWHRQI